MGWPCVRCGVAVSYHGNPITLEGSEPLCYNCAEEMADETQAPDNAPESDGARRWYEALQKLDKLATVQPIITALLDDAETFGWDSPAIEALKAWLANEQV